MTKDNLAPERAAFLGTIIDERYRVDALLGVGGFGSVFKAHHLALARDVAIKRLDPTATPTSSKHFEREAKTPARLDHPNCVRVTDFGTLDSGARR